MRNVTVLEETQYKNQRSMLTGGHVSVVDINKTQGRTMGLNDLLDIKWYNDNLKMFNQAWGATLLSLGNLRRHARESIRETADRGLHS